MRCFSLNTSVHGIKLFSVFFSQFICAKRLLEDEILSYSFTTVKQIWSYDANKAWLGGFNSHNLEFMWRYKDWSECFVDRYSGLILQANYEREGERGGGERVKLRWKRVDKQKRVEREDEGEREKHDKEERGERGLSDRET